MILIKTADEIELIRQSNLLVSKTLAELAKHIKPGVSTEKLDQIAEVVHPRPRGCPRIPGIPGISENALYFGEFTGSSRNPFREGSAEGG